MSNLLLPRRAFLAGLAASFAAPAIVRAASLMPIRAEKLVVPQLIFVRPLFSIRDESMARLRDWWIARQDEEFFKGPQWELSLG